MNKLVVYSIAIVMAIVMASCGGGNDPSKISQEVINNLKSQKPSESMRYVHPDDQKAESAISMMQHMVDNGQGEFLVSDYTLKETIENPESNAYLAVYSYPDNNIFGSSELYIFLQKIDGKWYYREQNSAGYISNIKHCIENGVELPPLCTDREARKFLN